MDYRPNPEFSYEGAKNKLANLQSILIGEEGVRFLIPGDSLTYDDGQGHDEFGSTSRQGKLIRISGWINLDSRVSLGCVGAVLTSLQRKRSAEFLQDDPDGQQAYRITSMEMFSMQGKMCASVNAMLSTSANIVSGLSMQTHCSPSRSSNPSLTPMLSTKAQAPRDPKSRFLYMGFFTTSHILLRGERDYVSSSCGPASTLKRSILALISSPSLFNMRT